MFCWDGILILLRGGWNESLIAIYFVGIGNSLKLTPYVSYNKMNRCGSDDKRDSLFISLSRGGLDISFASCIASGELLFSSCYQGCFLSGSKN